MCLAATTLNGFALGSKVMRCPNPRVGHGPPIRLLQAVSCNHAMYAFQVEVETRPWHKASYIPALGA